MEHNFPATIGQRFLINKINFYLSAYETTSIFPNSLLVSPKGTGKSFFAREVARNLFSINKKKGIKKPLIELNSAAIKSVDELFSQVLIPYCQDEHATLFFDEASELSKKISMFLLSALAPNKDNKNTITYNGMNFVIDFRKLTFLFATSESQRVFEALRDRLEPLQLSEYNNQELGKIIQKNLSPGFKIDNNVIENLASYSRLNPRSAFMLASSGINSYLAAKNKKIFQKEDIQELIQILDIFELGLNRYEVELLRVIGSRESSSLNMLCAKTGLTRASMMKMEFELLKYNLIEIKGQRRITPRGAEYLRVNKERLVAK